MKTRIMILALFAVLALVACGTQPAPQPTDEPAPVSQTSAAPPTPTEIPPTNTPTPEPAAISFANDITPILQKSCVNCHGGDRIEEGLVMKTYADLMAGSDNGAVVVPGNAAESLMVKMIASKKMPKRGPKLTDTQIQQIVDWINQGAMDN